MRDGVASKVVAAELGVHEHTVGKCGGAFCGIALRGFWMRPDREDPERPMTVRSRR